MEMYEVLAYIMLFWTLIYALSRALHLEKYGVDVTPFYLIYRTKRFNNALDKIAVRFKRFWLVALNISVIFAFGLMTYAIYMVTINLANFIYLPKKAGPIVPLVPLITISVDSLPYFVIASAIIILTHEAAHSIASRLENVEVKSSGILFFIVLFGAFVEPNEKQLKKSNFKSKTRVYAAGSLANLVVAVFAIIIIMNFSLMISPFYTSNGVILTQVGVGGPAYKAGLQANDVILEINSTSIATVEQFTSYISKVNPGNLLKLNVFFHNGSAGTVIVKTSQLPGNSSRAAMGINIFDNYLPKATWLPQQVPFYIYLQLSWIWLLAISVAIFNMLPIYPLDGDGFLISIVERFKKGASSKVRILTSALFLSILASNVILTALRFSIYPL